MRVLTVAAQKGGSGKTTIAISLAVGAHHAGRRVQIFDLDPQATAAAWGDRRGEAPTVISLQPARLARALDEAAAAGFDLAIIDTPPRLDHGTLGAVRAAQVLIIPCRPSVFDLETLGNTVDLVRISGTVATVLAVMNAVPPRGELFDKARPAIEAAGLEVCPVSVGQRAAFDKASLLGRGVQEFEPRGKAAAEIARLYDYCSRFLEK